MLREKDFLKLKVGDEIEMNGEQFIISSTGFHCGKPYVGISEIELGDGIETEDKPVPGTEYKLFYDEAKNNVTPMVDLSFR